MDFLRIHSELTSVRPEAVFYLGSFEITNSFITGALITLFLAVLVIFVRSQLRYKPGKLQNLAELVVENILKLLEQITSNRALAEKLLPLVGTILVYFIIANTITLLPGISSFSYNGVALFRGPTNDFNTTFSVAFAIIVLTHIMSIKQFGTLGHLGKFFKFKELIQGFKKGIGSGVVALIDFFIGLLDIVSEFAKVFSLSLRLFGNMFAGELLMALLLGAFALVVPTVLLAMSLLVGLVQAVVFGALTTAYYTMAVQTSESSES